jgi:hypothetical protein
MQRSHLQVKVNTETITLEKNEAQLAQQTYWECIYLLAHARLPASES